MENKMIRRVLPLLWVDFRDLWVSGAAMARRRCRSGTGGGRGDRGSPWGLGSRGGGSPGLSLAHAIP